MIEDVARLRLTVDSTGINEARAKLNQLGKGGQQSLGKLSAGATASRLALGGMAASITALGLTAAKTTKDWLKFNVAMKEVQTIAGVSGKEMDGLRLKALKLAQSLGVDATEAAQGFYQAISAGVPTDEVDKFVKVAAQLAQGGLTDIGSATDLLTTALNSYGKSVGEATKVSDQLIKTVVLGKTNIPQLASSLARASSTAATAGVSLEELLGITAATTKQGVKTAESFTQVKAAVVALLNPSETMAAIYQKLGVEGGRALIEQEGLAGALEKVRLAAGGSDQVLVKALRSIEAYSLTAAITGAKLAETKEAIEDVGKASGDTAAASKIVSETLGSSFKKLGNSLLIFAENANQATSANEGLVKSIANLSDAISDPDTASAYFEALNRFPEILGKWIFLGQNAEDQVEAFGKKLDEEAAKIRGYDDAVAESAQQRELRGLSQIEIAEKVLKTEKALAMQRLITEGSKGQIGKKGAPQEIEAEKALERRLKVLNRIGNKTGVVAELQFSIAKKGAEINEKLRQGKISTEEWRKESEKLQKEFDNAEGTIKEWGNLLRKGATYFKPLISLADEFNERNARASELAEARLMIQSMVLKEANKEIPILEKKLTYFDKITENGKELTTIEQEIKNIYENQLGILKEQSTERRKSAAQITREALREQLATKEESASQTYTKTVIEITKAKFKPEEEAEYLQRAKDALNEALEPEKQKATGISDEEREQERINAQVEMLGRQYATELELLAIHEEEKKNLINQSTKLTHEQKNELINKIDAAGVVARQAIAREELNMRLDATRQLFGGMSAIAGAFGKKGFKAAQAFSIAEATINTYQSATKAMASVPFPYNYLAAAGSIAYGLAQVAQIKAQQPPAYQQGGIVGGSSYGGDQINARLNSGEMVLNKQQQSNLFAQANNPLAGNNKKGNVTIINQTGSEIKGEVEQDSNGDMQIYISQAVKQTKDELTSEATYGGGNFLPALEKSYGLARK